MKSVHEALTIRAEVLRRFEDLCRFEDETIFSISVVGGGPTGVEMAGAFAELVRGPLKNDQQHAAAHIKINLIEAGSRILPMFSEKLSEVFNGPVVVEQEEAKTIKTMHITWIGFI
jgi:NADH dehydrogenase